MAGNINRISSTLAKSSIQLNPYQIHAAIYAFDSPLQRGAILSDEVGLGKTIEAGIVLSQLRAEGRRRILIICPASIRKQWQDELSNRFGLNSEVIDGPIFDKRVNSGDKIPLTYEGIFIVSLHLAYKKKGLIEKQPWNCVVIDEAHRLRNVYKGKDASKMAWEIRDIIKDTGKLLLTATPLQNNLMELYGIASFIDDKLLGTPYSFKKRFVDVLTDNGDLSHVKLKELRLLIKGEEKFGDDRISGILTRTLRKQVTDYVRFTERKTFTQDFTPTDEEIELYNKVSEYLQRPEIAAIQATQRNLMILVYRKLLASSSFAIAGTLEHLIKFLQKELELRQTDNETQPDLFTQSEIEDEGLEEEFEEVGETEEEEKKETKTRVDAGLFNDDEIQAEINELKFYYDLALKIKENSKGEALLKALKTILKIARDKDWPQKAVVFTESTRTQEYIRRLLEREGITYTIFNGSNNSREAIQSYRRWCKEFPESAEGGSSVANIRQALVYDFEKNKQVFISTEAGAEGLNLQFSNIVINYDLPWNPQRVEQRIGRCHRYGQKYDVLVVNFLNTKNRADQRVLELLEYKLHLFDGLFGSSDEVLGLLESGIDFEKKILEIYQTCRTSEEIDAAFNKLQESIQSKIADEVQNVRKQLTEYFDEPVRELFEQTKFEIDKSLSIFDRDLLRLCRLFYRDKLVQIDKEGTLYHFKDETTKKTLAFRELKEDEIGKFVRMNKENSIATKAIDESLRLNTSPIPLNYFLYTGMDKKYTLLEPLIGKEGIIYLFKLKIMGIEEEDILAPMTFIKRSKGYEAISLEHAEEILTLEVEEKSEKIEYSPLEEEKVLSLWEEWKKQVLEKYQRRNERLYDREVDRINRYYQDYSLRVDDRIRKLEEEKEDLNRKRDNSADLTERRELHKKIQDIELRLDRFRLEQIKLKQEANELKQKDYEELDRKFELKSEEELIAVTLFKVI